MHKLREFLTLIVEQAKITVWWLMLVWSSGVSVVDGHTDVVTTNTPRILYKF